jgi:hypothetical protein
MAAGTRYGEHRWQDGDLDPYPSDPTRLLAANKKFKATITTGAKNLAGIALESPKSWTFTTGSR